MTTLLLSVTRGPSSLLNQTRMVSSGAFQVGRARPSDWVLDDPSCVLSKRHCLFQQDETGWSVSDVSRNGSFVRRNGETRRLGAQPHRLAPGEAVRFGEYELAVDLQEDEASFRRLPVGGASRTDGKQPSPPPPDVPPRSYPRSTRTRSRLEEGEPTRLFLHRPAPPVRDDAGLSDLLAGAALVRNDMADTADDAAILRAAGTALRAAVAGLRDLRFATLGEASPSAAARDGGTEVAALPLTGARSNRAALARVLDAEEPGAAAIEAAFREVQFHHDWLVRAARRSLRDTILSLDPDRPPQQLLPQWLDLLPGWRQWRSRVLARRRFRRMTANLDRAVDQALAAAYWEVRREAETRWDLR